MRWVFFLLFAVNSGILIWGLMQPDPPTTRTTIVDPEIGDLQIISPEELDRLKLSSLSVEIDQRVDVADQDASIHNELPGAKISEEQALHDGQDDQIEVETEVSKITLLTPESIGASGLQIEPDAKVDEIEGKKERASESVPMTDFDSESGGDTGGTAEQQNSELLPPDEVETDDHVDGSLSEINAPEIVHGEVAVCKVLGPMEDEVIARSILNELERQEIVSILRTEPLRRVAGYWVVLPTYNDYDAAIEAIKKLKQQGIVDIQRFYRGDLKDAVSLGIYNRRFNAEKRKAQIEGKGFFPEILPRYTEIPAFWIDYRAESSSDAFDYLRDRYPALEAQDVECSESLRL